MKWFSNMRIGPRLICSFVLVSLIAGVVGVVAITNIKSIEKKDTELYKYMTVPIQIIGEIDEQFQLSRIDVRDMITANAPEEISKHAEDIQQRIATNTQLTADFEATMQSPEVKAAFAELATARKEYGVFLNQAIDLASENNDAKDIEAWALLNSDEMTTAVQNEMDSIAKIANLKVTDAKEKVDENKATANSAIIIMMICIIGGMVLAIMLGIVISNMISKPIKKLVGVAELIADGDLNVTVDEGKKDETGLLAAAFRRMSDKLNEVMTDISSAADQVASGSRQVSDSSIELSQGATEQASSIEQLTASIEEISSQTKLNASNSNQANGLAEEAKVNAVQGNSQMSTMIKAMEDINESSNNISKIIKVIDDIAFQTNILALNAAVEAARAGQYGRGFAVVAEEVRNLAARSADAAKETTSMIEGSIKKVEIGTKIANETAVALNKIVNGVDKVASLVGDIATASNEQSLGIDQINQGIMQVSQVVQTNSATSEESAAASEELSSQAELLKTQVSTFKLKKSHGGLSYYETSINSDSFKPSYASEDDYDNHATSSKRIILNDNEFGKY